MEGKLVLNINDDGDGFDTKILDDGSSFGILTMDQKAKAISGEFTLESSSGNGTTIKVEVPLTR